ncbi:Predicted Zn-dependent peptidase [Balnearium lithotrophicum]|uniref:Predicted Zn-dependent peptidase n=1 Tax=Balnearium lithotrophicum TaxID=223788 RepID=A0A521B103_9BACT|nr:pitrilysin family protein [Balnearium lithotrophicum]SMO40440.1 Predicted Zn-dependent peptidase [Balnearium lithotrophicum]
MVRVERLDNGVKVAVRTRRDLNSVTVSVWVRAGASYEKEENRGVAHFLEHMIFNGSQNLPPGSADLLVESVGGEINAATSYDYTYYYINLPAKHFKTALYVLSDLVLNPLLSEDMVEKEIPIVLEEIARSEDNPHEVFTERFLSEMYTEAPYRFPILGFKETVSKFSSRTVRDFYEELYIPERLTVVVCGNVDEDEVLKECEKLFGKFKRDGKVEEPPLERSPLNPKFFRMEHPAVSIPYVLLGWKLGPAGRTDINFDVLDSVLSSGRSSLLYRNLREKGFAFSASSNYQNLLLGSNFLIGISTERVDESLSQTREVLKEVVNLDEEEFLLGKRKLFKNEIFSREDGHAEAEALGFALGIMEDLGYYTEALSDLEKLKIEEFRSSIQFLKEEPLIGVLVPAAGGRS